MIGLNLMLPSSLDRIKYSIFEQFGIEVFAKRDDLIHPKISGNKWRKLSHNIAFYQQSQYDNIVSFGGAYSNHLYAMSEVCCLLKIPFTAIIRGDGYDENNQTLRLLKYQGHRLIFVSRGDYKIKEKSEAISKILKDIPNHFLIPEGGSNELALKGIIELCNEINWSQIDHFFVSAGTGATAAGILKYINSQNIDVKLHVVSALKGDFLKDEILKMADTTLDHRLMVHDDYHFGGYAKMPEALIAFQEKFHIETNMPMDLVYNSKTMFGLIDLIKNGHISKGSKVLFLNTGGRRV